MNIRGIKLAKASSSSHSEVQLPLINSESENLLEEIITDKEYNEAVGLELEEDVFEDIRDRFFRTFRTNFKNVCMVGGYFCGK